MVAVDRAARRVWIYGYRCHHGLAGVGLGVAGVLVPNPLGPVLLAVGVALIVDDWQDRPWPPTRLERSSP